MKVAVVRLIEVQKTYFVEVPDNTEDDDLMDAVAEQEGEYQSQLDIEDEPQTLRIQRLDAEGDPIDPPAWEND